MKVKTSITLSEDVVKALEGLLDHYRNRSDIIEEALREFFKKKAKGEREARDLQILDQKVSRLNEETQDVLSYQADL